jgi:LAO/AO transport system kinase
MLELQTRRKSGDWKPRVFMTQARKNLGIDELMAGVKEHQEHLSRDGGRLLQAARLTRLRSEFLDLLKEGLFAHLMAHLTRTGRLDEILLDIQEKRTDPYSAGEDLIRRIPGPV